MKRLLMALAIVLLFAGSGFGCECWEKEGKYWYKNTKPYPTISLTDPTKEPKTCWEYKVSHNCDKDIRGFCIGPATLIEYKLNQDGSARWELLFIDDGKFYFKRPKPCEEAP